MNRTLTAFLVFLVAVQALDTVKELDINAYLGDWYEVASSPLVRLTFERNGFCQRATYTLRDDGYINVVNQ
jgi:lipocalin